MSSVDKTFAAYLGENTKNYAAGFVIEGSYFGVLEIRSTDAQNKLRLATESIRSVFKEKFLMNPKDLQLLSQKLINQHQLAAFSVGYFKQSQIYTFAQGAQLLLLRQKQLYSASQNNSALAGQIKASDFYFFTSQDIVEHLTQKTKLEFGEPKEIINQIKEDYSPQPGALLAVKIGTIEETSQPIIIEKKHKTPKTKWLKIGLLAIILLAVLIQGIGVLSKTLEKQKQKKFQEKLVVLENKYQSLQKSLQSKPTEAASEIETVLAEIEQLLEKYPEQKNEIKPLNKKIITLKNTYGSAQSSEDKVFFDLSLIDKKATANYLKVSSENLSLLDNQNKKAYLVSIDNKNVSEVSFEKFSQGQLVAEYNQTLFLYSQKNGLYKEVNGKFSKIVNYQKSWGNIIDMSVFNSNVYLLSTTKDEIFKFTPASGGYSSAISYFQSGQSLDLAAVKSMAIDFSVYLLGNKVYKYTAGALDSYKTLDQLDYQSFAQIYKNPDTNYVYLLDNTNGRVIVLNEDGKLIKSVFNNKLKKCRHFGVFQDEKIIFLHQNKLYVLDNF